MSLLIQKHLEEQISPLSGHLQKVLDRKIRDINRYTRFTVPSRLISRRLTLTLEAMSSQYLQLLNT